MKHFSIDSKVEKMIGAVRNLWAWSRRNLTGMGCARGKRSGVWGAVCVKTTILTTCRRSRLMVQSIFCNKRRSLELEGSV